MFASVARLATTSPMNYSASGKKLAHLCRQSPGLSSTLATKPIIQSRAPAAKEFSWSPSPMSEGQQRNKIARCASARAAGVTGWMSRR